MDEGSRARTRGCSRSVGKPYAAEGYFARHSADAAELLTALGAAPASVLGWSSGGIVALTPLAVDHPILNGRNADALLPYWAEDLVEEFPTGTLRGREAVRAHFAALFAALPDFHIEVKAIAQNGDVLFVRWRMTGTFSGVAWMGLEPTGSSVELDGIDSFTFG